MKKILAVCAGLLVVASALADDGLTLGTGLNYSTGSYGTASTTRIVSVPFLLKYNQADWSFKLTLPYLQISGGAGVVPGLGNVNRAPQGRGGAGGSTQGLGDAVLAASYTAYYNSAASLGIDLTGKVKLATADRNKGLGTGENDYAAQVDVYQAHGPLTLLGGVGYTVFGSSSSIPLTSAFNWTAGAAYKLSDANVAGLSYDAREPLSAGAAALSEMMVYLNHKIDRHWKTQAYALKGLANGSPDWGGGINLLYAY